MFYFRYIYIIFFILLFGISNSQVISLSDSLSDKPPVLLRKEKSGFVMIHSSGFGLGYRTGKHITGYKKKMFEIELTGMKHPKEIKTRNPSFDNSKSYILGKENVFFIIRGGYGRQKIINSKPYWGGAELRFFYYGGFSLGLLKPVYLYILKETGNPNKFNLATEKYDPNIHFPSNIYGRTPVFYKFFNIKPVPGIYAKMGLNFEYSTYSENIKAIETGITFDAYLKPVLIMADNKKNNNYFLSVYLSVHIGRRGN